MKVQGSVNGKSVATPVTIPIPTVNINKWDTGSGYLISYTAKWCGPCQRVKPALLELTSMYIHKGSQEIPKNKRPSHVEFIPWFDLLDYDGNITASIQTSKATDLATFLPLMFIDENF